MTDPPKKTHFRIELIEWIARGTLVAFALASVVLAAVEDHEAIGTAFVGAAIAFCLGAAFFDRVIEVSTKGVKLTELRALKEAAEREVPNASPDEKEALVAEGTEILASKRSAGESITPDLAFKEASLSWMRNGLAAEMRVASWLVEHEWTVAQAENFIGTHQPDLVAEKDGRRIAVEVKVGRRPLGVDVVHQVLALVASVEATQAEGGDVHPVLVLGEVPLTRAATEHATREGISVYLLDADNQITHLMGPKLD